MTIRDTRNIGITAHIDSGKTTLAERVLFYTGRIRAIHEVRGRDKVGATLDFDPQERRRGISIQAAATSCAWRGHQINLIDTPGHVDFTIEVERALRVLDGAVLLLCAVSGVQAQTIAVCRQMDRYQVPRVVFVNKCDLPGADPIAVVEALKERLDMPAVAIQLPLWEDGRFEGIIDVINQRVLRFVGEYGEHVVVSDVPETQLAAAQAARETLLDVLSLHSDTIFEALIDDTAVTADDIHQALRAAVCAHQIVPVMMGTAYGNKGVQPLLNAVVRYLPSPEEVSNTAWSPSEEPVHLSTSPHAEPVALAFKIQETPHGTLTWLRVYQGMLSTGARLHNVDQETSIRVGRLVRLHAGSMERIDAAAAGSIVALFGAACSSGDTLTGGSMLRMSRMHVPEPVVEVSLQLSSGKTEHLKKALARFVREDPSIRAFTDRDSGELRLCGMGELQLEVYAERLRREYGCSVILGRPKVAHRQTLSQRHDFNHLHRKQNGGRGQFAKIIGYIEPCEEHFAFSWEVAHGEIPGIYREAIRRGFQTALSEQIKPPMVGVRVVITGGASHSDDSSEMVFSIAAKGALRSVIASVEPVILEPIMRVEAEVEVARSGAMLRTLLSRRGQVLSSEIIGRTARASAEVPLVEMFGYASVLKSATAGSGSFTMRFQRFEPRR